MIPEKFADQVVEELYWRLLAGDHSSLPACKRVLVGLANHEQKVLLYAFIRVLSKRHAVGDDALLRGAGAIILGLTSETPSLQEYLVSWLVGTQAEAVGQSNIMHRAVVLAISTEIGKFIGACETLATHEAVRSCEKYTVESIGTIW